MKEGFYEKQAAERAERRRGWMHEKDMVAWRDRVGQIGVDRDGRRFMVLAPGTIYPDQSCDPVSHVVLMPDTIEVRFLGVGHVVHYSHLRKPITWETK